MKIVPDTSVLIDGRVSRLLKEGKWQDVEVLVPEAVVAELETQAHRGMETGYDGLEEIRGLAAEKRIRLRFVGARPTFDQVQLADAGEIDAMVRDFALEEKATLVTSDWIQARLAEAKGVTVEYLRRDPEVSWKELRVLRYFRPDVMSVHLRAGAKPRIKRGQPGDMQIEVVDEPPTDERALREMTREIVEVARVHPKGFLEMDEGGATVVQLDNLRIAVARPPFADGCEVTSVRPVAEVDLERYEYAEEIKRRLRERHRGLLVAGAPGAGKSTLAQAIAEYLESVGWIVKTMEKPRDLQVSENVTQYTALGGDFAKTADFLLLVRPDYTIYDELRKTSDFEVFGDMRLAGVGMVGVVHATRGIDAVQRLIGRVELGMIPQVVDTILYVDAGQIQRFYDVRFTVKVPAGMVEADLARPVIEVVNHATGKVEFEVYTFGEEVVVMPVEAIAAEHPLWRLAEPELARELRDEVGTRFEVTIDGDRHATLYVDDDAIGRIIGPGGSRVKELEADYGFDFEVKGLSEAPRKSRGGEGPARKDEGGARPEITEDRKSLFLKVPRGMAGKDVEVLIDGSPVFRGSVGRDGARRFGRRSEIADRLLDAKFKKRDLRVRAA